MKSPSPPPPPPRKNLLKGAIIAFDIKVDLTFRKLRHTSHFFFCKKKETYVFLGNSKSEDYHLEMSSAHVKEWLTEKVLPTI